MIKKPLVLTDGRLEQLQAGDTLLPSPDVIEVINGETVNFIAPGCVYLSGASTCKYAQANTDLTYPAIGMIIEEIAPGNTGLIQLSGILTLPTAAWDLATGETGGLTPGAIYFLSDTVIGSIRQIAPSNGYVLEMGRAFSSIDFEIKIGIPIKL